MGYDTLRTVILSNRSNHLVMLDNARQQSISNGNRRLHSLTKNLPRQPGYSFHVYGESYTETVENGFVSTASFPTTGFSPNGNNASYSNIRRFINQGSKVPPDAVRIDEMLNYFSLNHAPEPDSGQLFNTRSLFSTCPWNPGNFLLFINTKVKTINLDQVPAANLVFLVDNSGSMDMPNRLPLLKSGFKMLVNNLRDTDRVAIVTYGGSAAIALPPTSGCEKEKILQAIRDIVPGGSTPGSNGIQMAYELASHNALPHGNNRVILATDGDFNVGISAEKELEKLIEGYKKTGIYLTCLGVGMGNYKDSKIEVLARYGNGNFAYLDNEQEVEKVLVKELTQNLYAVASDLTIQIELNPDLFKDYRLIGYDNRKEAILDSTSQLLGSEIGSGFSIVALLELNPLDTSAAWRLKMKNAPAGGILMRFTNNQTKLENQELRIPIPFQFQPLTETPPVFRLAAGIALFGNLLRQSPFTLHQNFMDVKTLLSGAIYTANLVQEELITLVDKAAGLYQPPARKKRRGRFF